MTEKIERKPVCPDCIADCSFAGRTSGISPRYKCAHLELREQPKKEKTLEVTSSGMHPVTDGSIRKGYTFWTSKGGILTVSEILVETKYGGWIKMGEVYISYNWRMGDRQGADKVSVKRFLEIVQE